MRTSTYRGIMVTVALLVGAVCVIFLLGFFGVLFSRVSDPGPYVSKPYAPEAAKAPAPQQACRTEVERLTRKDGDEARWTTEMKLVTPRSDGSSVWEDQVYYYRGDKERAWHLYECAVAPNGTVAVTIKTTLDSTARKK